MSEKLPYKIIDVEEDTQNLKVLIRYPNGDERTMRLRYREDLFDTIKYEKDGEVIEEPKWKKEVKKSLQRIEDQKKIRKKTKEKATKAKKEIKNTELNIDRA